MTPAAAVVVLADAPDDTCLPGLAELLAADARAGLQMLLIRQAAAWAAALAPGRAVLAVAGDAPEDLSAELPAGIALVAGAGAAAGAGSAALVDAARAVAGAGGPLILCGAAWPRLKSRHVAAALDDIAAGARAVYGPALDGGAYLVGLAPPVPDGVELPIGPAGLPRALEAAQALDHEIGLLRHERALATPDDAAAFLADPLLAPGLRAALGAG